LKALRSAAFAILVSLVLVVPNVVFAHSALVSSEPSGTADTEVSELKLTFKEGIESRSKIVVVNEAGEEQALSDIKTKGKALTATFENPLANGVYTVDWKIISADGHPLTGSYTLKVEVPEPSPTPTPAETAPSSPVPAESGEPTESGTPVPSEEAPSASPSPSVQATEEAEDSDGGSGTGSGSFDLSIWIVVAAAVLLVAAAVSVVLKKKKE